MVFIFYFKIRYKVGDKIGDQSQQSSRVACNIYINPKKKLEIKIRDKCGET